LVFFKKKKKSKFQWSHSFQSMFVLSKQMTAAQLFDLLMGLFTVTLLIKILL